MQSNAFQPSWQVAEPDIMDVTNYLSSANAPDVQEDVRLCIASGAREMILNCSSLTYMTGAGLRAFVNIARMMRQVDGSLSITGLSGQPREIFDACGIESLIPAREAVLYPSFVQAA